MNQNCFLVNANGSTSTCLTWIVTHLSLVSRGLKNSHKLHKMGHYNIWNWGEVSSYSNLKFASSNQETTRARQLDSTLPFASAALELFLPRTWARRDRRLCSPNRKVCLHRCPDRSEHEPWYKLLWFYCVQFSFWYFSWNVQFTRVLKFVVVVVG